MLHSKPISYSVIICNFNGGAYVQAALDSLARQNERSFEVLLVDNASTDGSVDALDTSRMPSFTLLRQSRNLGFAAANNLAAQQARGRWLVLLNPDAEAADDWLSSLGAGANRHPNVRMFASLQYDLHNPDRLDGAGDCYLGFGIPWRGGFGHMANATPGEGYCFSPCGAGAMYDRETFLSHGGFDERFFCYCEDVDLAFRMRLNGEVCVFLPDAIIHHAGGGLSGRTSDFSIFHGARNRIWTYVKNMPMELLVLTLPVHLALSIYILLRGAMTGRVRSTWRGMVSGVAGLPDMRTQTRWSPPKRRVRLTRLAAAMSWNVLRMSSRLPDVRRIDCRATRGKASVELNAHVATPKK